MILDKSKNSRATPIIFSAFVVLGVNAFIASHMHAFDRSSQEIASELQQFESCKMETSKIISRGVSRMGDFLECQLTPEQMKIENVEGAMGLKEKIEKEIATLSKDNKEDLRQHLVTRSARVMPDKAVDEITLSASYFKSCDLVTTNNANIINCTLTEYQFKDLESAQNNKKEFTDMNLKLSQLDSKSVSKLSEKIQKLREAKSDNNTEPNLNLPKI